MDFFPLKLNGYQVRRRRRRMHLRDVVRALSVRAREFRAKDLDRFCAEPVVSRLLRDKGRAYALFKDWWEANMDQLRTISRGYRPPSPPVGFFSEEVYSEEEEAEPEKEPELDVLSPTECREIYANVTRAVGALAAALQTGDALPPHTRAMAQAELHNSLRVLRVFNPATDPRTHRENPFAEEQPEILVDVRQRARDLGLLPSGALCERAGRTAANVYLRTRGIPPPKRARYVKDVAGRSKCVPVNVYPPSALPIVDAAIEKAQEN